MIGHLRARFARFSARSAAGGTSGRVRISRTALAAAGFSPVLTQVATSRESATLLASRNTRLRRFSWSTVRDRGGDLERAARRPGLPGRQPGGRRHLRGAAEERRPPPTPARAAAIGVPLLPALRPGRGHGPGGRGAGRRPHRRAAHSRALGFQDRVRAVRMSSESVERHPSFARIGIKDWQRVQRILDQGEWLARASEHRLLWIDAIFQLLHLSPPLLPGTGSKDVQCCGPQPGA